MVFLGLDSGLFPEYLRNATGKTKIIGSNGVNICIKGIIDNASALL